MRLWGGRFEGSTNAQVADYTRSIDVDRALALDDRAGSVAHGRGRGRAELLAPMRWMPCCRPRCPAGRGGRRDPGLGPGPRGRPHEPRGGAGGPHRPACRQAPHRPLAQRPGGHRPAPLGAPGRRRPRRRGPGDGARPRGPRGAGGRGGLPGATHVQPAQPVLLAHHLLAYVEMLERDRGRLADCRRPGQLSPLGSGALAGAGYPLDREATARELGFDAVTANSLDAVSIATSWRSSSSTSPWPWSTLPPGRGGHLVVEPALRVRPRRGRLLDWLVDDAEQENPDPAELVRGRAARIVGSLAGLLALLKGLPLAYQRDLQEDKPPLFEACATLEASLEVMAGLVATLAVDRAAMRRAAEEGFITATAVADRWSAAASRSASPTASWGGWWRSRSGPAWPWRRCRTPRSRRPWRRHATARRWAWRATRRCRGSCAGGRHP